MMKLVGLFLIVLFSIDSGVVSDAHDGCSGYRTWLTKCHYDVEGMKCFDTESFECHPTQSDGKSSWCVEAQGAAITYTFAKTERFPYDCRGTRGCVTGTVREFSFRCDATCDEALAEGYKTKFNCYNKCICPRGQYKSKNGNCIWLGDCRRQECIAPKVFENCPSKCQPTCQNPKPDLEKCETGCQESTCVCPAGSVLLSEMSGKCVELSQCPNCTTPAVPVKCTNACPESCEPRPPICIRDCESKYVCGCPTGFVLNARDGTKCLRREECPPPCPPPKRYANCASLCQPTCQDPSPGLCRRGCNPRECFCPVGMVQPAEDDFSCISLLDCPKSCAASKVYKQCPSKCQPTCENLEPNREQCDSGCREDVCVCPEEKVLLNKTSDKCVMPSQCPIRCQFPEVRANCRTTCSVRCDNLATLDVQDCDVECGEEFCACADGYVQKNELNQTCVLVASCPLLPS